MKMSKCFSEWVGCSPVCPDLSIAENDFVLGCDFKGRCTCLAGDPKHSGESQSPKLDILRWLPFTGTIHVIVIYLLLKVGCCC